MNVAYNQLRQALLSGTITSANLQTLLTTNTSYATALEAMAGHQHTMDLLSNSATAMGILQGSGRAMALILEKEVGHVDFIQSPHFIQPNAAGTKLKRDVFTANGTWTAPAGGVSDVMALCAGGGGGGGGAGASIGHYLANAGGGGGGEVVSKRFTSITAGQSVLITVGPGGTSGSYTTNGGSGNTTSFGTLFSALGGSGGGSIYGSAAGSGGAGGGSVTLGQWVPTFSTVSNLAWVPSFQIKGGNGGSGGYSGASCTAQFYIKGLMLGLRTFVLGAGGSISYGGLPGGFASGAGGGNSNTSGMSDGFGATANTGGGGGGAIAFPSGGFQARAGGAGGSGLVVVYYTIL